MAWNCPAAYDIWAACSLPKHKLQRNVEDIHYLWDKINTSLQPSEVETTTIIRRQIWLRRNMYVFQETLHPPHRVIMVARLEKDEYFSAHCLNQSVPSIVRIPR